MSELYKEAATLLDRLERRHGGLKSLAFADSVQHKQSSFALVCETLRFAPLLRELIASVPECVKFSKKLKNSMQQALLLVSLYDLLFGHHKIQGSGFIKKHLMGNSAALKAALVRKKIASKVSTDEALLPIEHQRLGTPLPRYVRVNTLKISEQQLKNFFKNYEAIPDAHVQDLLVLPAGTDLHAHELVERGALVLQDKASCFPAFILHGEHGDLKEEQGDVIDACAAPGNKTSHVAMLLQQQAEKSESKRGQDEEMTSRHVYAFDRSPERLKVLKRRMELLGADSIVQACLQSFLEVDPNDAKYANVRSILLDPSCSGSGMHTRLDHLLDAMQERTKQQQEHTRHESEHENQHEGDGMNADQKDPGQSLPARLESLAAFQLEALCKAFSFPQVERVSYSTCSVYDQENEQVVAQALASQVNLSASRPFELRPCLASWHRRGREVAGLSAEQAKSLVRVDPLEDLTNGFFVAYFERTKTSVKRAKAPTPPPTSLPSEESSKPEIEAEDDTESLSATSKKRPMLSDSQREARKRRKKEKRKKSKQQKAQQQ